MNLYDKIFELGKRRGIFFPSFEIYGGLSGFYDYGPVGSLLKKNIEDKWRGFFVYREGMVELESTIIMPKQVFLASGHLSHFTDISTKCSHCGKNYRVDYLLNKVGVKSPERLKAQDLELMLRETKCPECGGNLSKPEPFNLMFELTIGAHSWGQKGYGRPEAGQGQFVDFKRIFASERERLPLGIAQVGRCIRNEIAPRKGPIRLREFTIVDYEIFFDPDDTSYPRIHLMKNFPLRILSLEEQIAGTNRVNNIEVEEALNEGLVANEILCYFMVLSMKFLKDLGIPLEKQRFREQLPEERAHYSKQTYDQEVWLERWGWTEVSGHSYRTDYDLRNHMAHSGIDLRVYKAFNKPRKIIEVTVEPMMKQLINDFGSEESMRIEKILAKSDPVIVERELREKGFYEITGLSSIKLKPKYLNVNQQEIEAFGSYFIPHVVEPSFGIDRILYAVLEYAYSKKGKRTLFKLPRDIAPIKAAIFPLVNKDTLPKYATKIYRTLLNEGYIVKYDESGSIGRRYARADEIGIPLCITIDYQTINDNTITLRDLYSWKQVRVNINELPNLLNKYFKKKLEFNELGKAL